MTTQQEAREAWFEREERASLALTWPLQERRGTDPKTDPDYPYDRSWERQCIRDADRNSPYVVECWRTRVDDFDPDVNERRYVLDGPPERSGEGAIYTPEYLARTQH